MSEKHCFAADLYSVFAGPDCKRPNGRRRFGSEFFLGLFRHVGTLFQFGLARGKVHRKSKAGWNPTLSTIGLGQQLKDLNPGKAHVVFSPGKNLIAHMKPGADPQYLRPDLLSANNAFHCQSGMSHLFKECINLVFGSAVFFGCNHIDEIRNAQFLAALDKPISDFLFEHFWHPHKPHEATVTRNELALSYIILAVTHKTRRNVSAADR